MLLTGDNRIAGYYTLSASIILAGDVPTERLKKLKWPRYPELPATLIGRLARDLRFRGQGIGDLLLMDALRRVFFNDEIASLAVIVDSKGEHARRFYEQYGFLSFSDTRNRLYLPMETIGQLLRPAR